MLPGRLWYAQPFIFKETRLQSLKCTVVWIRPWLNSSYLSYSSCSRDPRALPRFHITLISFSRTGSCWVHAALSSCSQPAPSKDTSMRGQQSQMVSVSDNCGRHQIQEKRMVLITRQRRKAPLTSSRLSPRATIYKKRVMLQISNLHKSRAQHIHILAGSSTSAVLQTACCCWGPNFSHLLRWLQFYARAK